MAARDRIHMPDPPALARLCEAHHATGLWLFGSVLRPDFRPESDVDVLDEFAPHAHVGLLALSRFQRELSQLLGRHVDLVPLRGLKPAIVAEVMSAREVLYAA